MNRHQLFNEINRDFYRKPAVGEAQTSFGLARGRKNLCDCGESFLQFAKEYMGEIMADPTPPLLENALLTLLREFLYRRRFTVPHKLNCCLEDVFFELATLLNDKLEELNRQPASGGAVHLVLGEESTQAAGNAE